MRAAKGGGEEDKEGSKVNEASKVHEASKASKAHWHAGKEGTAQGRLELKLFTDSNVANRGMQVSQWLAGAQPWVQTHVSRSLPQAS